MLEGLILEGTLLIFLAYPGQAVLASGHDMIGHMHQLGGGTRAGCSFQGGSNQLVRAPFPIRAAHNS
jgi:hypothetical protein